MTGVGVDIGGSGIRVRTTPVDGAPGKARDRGGIAWTGGEIDLPVLAERVVRLIAEIPTVDPPVDVAIGMTGMPGLIDHPETLATQIATRLEVRRVAIAGDALTTHLGSLTGEPGTIVAAGTGVIAIGTDHTTIWNQADGWGYLLGDDGGGAWVGAVGLRAAFRQLDGRRGGSPALLRRALERHGSVDELLRTTYGSPSPANEIAQFAPDVAAAAAEGDLSAIDIWNEAGRLLAQAAFAASTGLVRRYSWGGRLFSAGRLLIDPFTRHLHDLDPDAEVIPPRGQSAEGALRLATDERLFAPERYLRVFPGSLR